MFANFLYDSNTVDNKEIFLVVVESTLSGRQYLDIVVRSLETPHVSTSTTVNLYHVRLLATALLKQMTMLLDLLEATETLSASLLTDAAK